MIDILRPTIFERSKIQCGVTKINKRMFPKTGLSLSPAEILNPDETNIHLQLFAHSRGIAPDNIVFSHQIHSDIINIAPFDFKFEEGDALISKEKELMLVVKIADCAAILIFDKEEEVIAAVHSGWRGTQKKILNKTINLMKSKFGSKPKNLICYISPCASGEKYEVGKEFLDLFPETTQQVGKNRYFFDNRAELNIQLKKSRVPAKNIEISDICTISNEDYHSFRRDGAMSGRMAAFIMMKKKS